MKYVVFKSPRTGSSTLAEILSDNEKVICIPEILNKWDGGVPAQKFIDDILSKNQRLIKGFTLYPHKHRLTPSFYSFDSGCSVFMLYREDIFSTALSLMVSAAVKSYPNNTAHKSASKVLDYIDEKKYLDSLEFENRAKTAKANNGRIERFSHKFAKLHSESVVRISYEDLFWGDGFEKIENKLNIKLDRGRADSSNKLLKNPESWLTNYDELKYIAERVSNES